MRTAVEAQLACAALRGPLAHAMWPLHRARKTSPRGSGSCGGTWHRRPPRSRQSRTCTVRLLPEHQQLRLHCSFCAHRHIISESSLIQDTDSQAWRTHDLAGWHTCHQVASVEQGSTMCLQLSLRRTCTCARRPDCSPGAGRPRARAPRPPATRAASPRSAARCLCSPARTRRIQHDLTALQILLELVLGLDLVSAHLCSGVLSQASCAVMFQGTEQDNKMTRGFMCVGGRGRTCTERPVPRAASTMAPMEGRWPPGKMCSRMKSEDAQYAS